MDIEIAPGKYVVAVSGGVDSVVLLDLLCGRARASGAPSWKLVVAHYDHGIREDSDEDKKLVEQLARRHGVPFVFDRGHLGPGTSEAVARTARYAFLESVMRASGSDAVLTAHHRDDALETAVINLARGTGRKGLSSLANNGTIVRPLLGVSKKEIIEYAKYHGLVWHEDSTNTSTDYLRNHIRHNVLPKWREADKQRLLAISRTAGRLNAEIDALLEGRLGPELEREWFVLLPHDVAREVMASWLRSQGLREFDRRAIERLTVGAKVARSGKSIDAVKGYRLQVGRDNLALRRNER
ncbi:MAG TPA: tRNA lysidine(34) synthetase TilS [Candidatus Saccharimonadales bacterium]